MTLRPAACIQTSTGKGTSPRPQPGPVGIPQLVAEYSITLYRVAFSISRNPAEAEDAVQETFLQVVKHQARLTDIRDYRTWLVRIVWNVALDRKRRSKVRGENGDIADHAHSLTAPERPVVDSLISSQEHARILELIDRLPPRLCQVLLLSAIEELSSPETATILGITESAVRSLLFRARRGVALLLASKQTRPRRARPCNHPEGFHATT